MDTFRVQIPQLLGRYILQNMTEHFSSHLSCTGTYCFNDSAWAGTGCTLLSSMTKHNKLA